MATSAPEGLDVTDLKFKLQNKVPIYKGDGNVKASSNLLAAASVHGLVFAGTTGPQMRVLQLKDITQEPVINAIVPLRTVPLPSEPFQMAVSCDHGFLAVDVVVNGVSFIYIYLVPSFLTPSIVKLHEIRTSPEGGIRSTQILWNPVIHNMFSVRSENGALSVYTLKDPAGIEFHSLDKSEGVICACWSPKGKQLVVGFANGKLAQYKPDLKPARTIACPPGVVEGSFDVIAVQWLSTYQFAAVFMPRGEDSVPALFIVNAPKAGNPVFINYDDICYSQSGPRKGQVFLLHVLQWNLLLMASANSMEVGILGTSEAGETPTWCQWTTTDEARAELPLTSDKQESFPVGLALETGCGHQVTVGEQVLPVMPMIHLLSTYGLLVSFNVLNLAPNIPNICSPPKPVMDTSGKFEKIDYSRQPGSAAVAAATPTAAEISFAVPLGATSTPALPKSKSFFSPSENKSPMNLFGSASAGAPAGTTSAPPIAPSFGKQITFGGVPPASIVEPTKIMTYGGGTTPAFGTSNQAFAPPISQQSLLKTTLVQPQKAPEPVKPLVTVPPTYTPPAPADVTRSGSSGNITQQAQKPTQKKPESSDDTNLVIRSMITEEIRKFERELSDLQNRCKSLNITIGSKDESAKIIKNLKELQDLSVQAAESTESLTSDVQALRLGLNEAFAMVAEANSKNAIFKHPSPNQFQETHAMSQSSRRQLASLQNMLAVNDNQLHIVNKQIDAQWSSIQDANRLNSKRRMHVPSLEVLYQTLSKQQEILNRQREKLSYIKGKLGMRESIRGLEKGSKKRDLTADGGAAIDSLTDSIISMTIADQVKMDARRLNEAKMGSLRNMLRNRRIVTIKPGRPDRVGLNSEVVRERRNEVRRLNFEKEKCKVEAVKHPLASSVQARKMEDIRKPQQKAAVQPAVPVPVKATKAPEPVKTFELPKATALPSFGPKLGAVSLVAAAVAPAVSQSTTTTGAFNFAPSQTAVTNTTSKATTMFAVPAASTTTASVFSFGQTTQPIGQPSKPKEPSITKETTLFGSTTIKPIPAASVAASKDKENQEPASKPTPLFGFGSTTIQAIPRAEVSTVTSDSTKSVVSFGSNSNNKPSTFSFGAATGGPLTFGASQPGASTASASAAPALKLAKEKEPEQEEQPREAKKGEPLPPGTGHASTEDGAKSSFPTLTNLLQTGGPATTETAKTQSVFGSVAKTPASTVFGTSTATIAPGSGLFGSIKSTTTPASSTTTSGGLFSQYAFGGTQVSSSAPSLTATTADSVSTTTTSTTATSTLFGSVKASTTTSAGGEFAFGGFGDVTSPTDLSVKPDTPKTDTKPDFGIVSSTPASVTATVVTNAAIPTAASSAATASLTATSSASNFSFGSVTAPTTVSTAPVVSSTVAATDVAPSSTTDTTSNLFGSFNICSPTAPANSNSTSTNIFGVSSFTAPKSEPASIFGGTSSFGTAAGDSSKTTSVFGSTPAATSTSTAGTGLFGTVTSTAGGSIFGGSSTPSSPFGATTAPSTGGLFGSVAASPTASASSGGSIFGGASTATQQPSSPFGAATPATTSSSLFGTSSAPGGVLFGSAGASPAAGGSIFGGTSAFGSANTSSGNIFGNAAPGATTGGFGSSTFGQPSTPQPVQSIFGGAGNTSGFGNSSFGSPAPSGGAFSQPTGDSVAQTGFGSPTSSAFNKPAFGGTASFGGAASFGGTAAFAGAPAFGSPPAFGSKPAFGGGPTGFGQASLSPSSQSNSLFEQLGASSSGVSFGNLAQQQTQKPAQFGGSSFSSWRS